MSPYDLTTLAALKAWLGLPAGAGPNDATLAALITAASRTDLRGAEPARPAAAVLHRDARSRDAARHPPAMAGAAGQCGAVARHRRPARSERRSRRVGRLRPSAGRRRAAGPAAGDRSVRRLLSSGPTEPRRLLSRRLRRAGRGADGSRLRRRSSLRPSRPMGRGGPISASSTPRPARRSRPSPRRRAAGQYAVSAGVYTFSAADAGQALALSYGYVAAGRRAGGARARGRALPRRRAHRPQVEIGRRPGDDRLRHERDPGADPGDAAALQAGGVLMFAIGLDGLDETSARLDALPAALGAALAAKAAELSAALADRVRNDKLSGAVLNARSGALRDSIAADVSADGDGVRRLGRLDRRRQICGDPGIRRQDRGARDPAGQGAGARLHRRRRAAFRPQGRASRLGDPGAVLSALLARRDERRDRLRARRGRGRSLERA